MTQNIKLMLCVMCLDACMCPFGKASPQEVQTAKGDLMADIIANVTANELLYTDIEVITRSSYRYVGDGQLPGLFKEQISQRRAIWQGDWLYNKEVQAAIRLDGNTSTYNELSGYDGRLTRRIVGRIANIHQGRYEGCVVFRPHILLLVKAFICLPLSVYLRGGEYLGAHADAHPTYKELDHRVSFDKEDIINGLRCFKLRCQSWEKGGAEKPYIRFLWLAPERNYLPVKTAFHLSESSPPGEVGIVEELREIKPGVWFPFAWKITVFDDSSTREKPVTDNEEEWEVEKVVLDPKYPISLFRDIPIPDETVVYEINNGETTKSYVQGGMEVDQSVTPDRTGLYVVLLISLGVALIVAAERLVHWARLKRKGQSTGAS